MKVLFCSLASPGFLYPCMGIALELKKRGHTSRFVIGQSFGDELGRNGLIRIPRGPQDGPSFDVFNWAKPLAVAIQFKHIAYAVQLFQPDILVAQPLVLSALLAKERFGMPLAQIGFATYLWPPQDASYSKFSPETAERKRWRYSDTLRLHNDVRALLRMEPVSDHDEALLVRDLFMVRSVPELEHDFENLPDCVHLAGACLWESESPDPALESWLNDPQHQGKPLIYVQQGRFFQAPNFWPKLVEGLSCLDVRVAASTERMDCETGPVGPNFYIRPCVPQSRVLNHAQAAVFSGNSTAVLGALSAAVPSLLIPAGGEQPDVAERVAESGAARILQPDEATPERLCSEIEILLNDQPMKQAAARISTALKRVDSFSLAADMLEILAAKRAPVTRREQLLAMASMA